MRARQLLECPRCRHTLSPADKMSIALFKQCPYCGEQIDVAVPPPSKDRKRQSR